MKRFVFLILTLPIAFTLYAADYKCSLDLSSVHSLKPPLMDRRGFGDVYCKGIGNKSYGEMTIITNCKTLETYIDIKRMGDIHGNEAPPEVKKLLKFPQKGSDMDDIGHQICDVVGREWDGD
jgi:hypothetical protein